MTAAKRLVTLTQNRGSGYDTHINVTGGRLFKFIGTITDPSSGEAIKNAWSMRRHNGANYILVTRDDVELAMHQHGWTL